MYLFTDELLCIRMAIRIYCCCCCCLFCVCFSSSFFVCRHFFTFLRAPLCFRLSSTKNDKKTDPRTVKACSVRFRALWSSPRVPSLVLIQEERTERDEEELRHVLHEKKKEEEKERWILRTIPTIGTMLPNARQLEIIMTIKELGKTEEKR